MCAAGAVAVMVLVCVGEVTVSVFVTVFVSVVWLPEREPASAFDCVCLSLSFSSSCRRCRDRDCVILLYILLYIERVAEEEVMVWEKAGIVSVVVVIWLVLRAEYICVLTCSDATLRCVLR